MTIRRALRWLGDAGLGLVAVLVIVIVAVYAVSEYRVRKTYDFTVAGVQVPNDSSNIARGEHVAMAIAHCADCHGGDFGGGIVFEVGPIGRVAAPIITPGNGGNVPNHSDEELMRVLKFGVDKDGRPLALMGWGDNISEVDAGAVVAFIRSLEPVDREMPGVSLTVLGRAFYLLGFFGEVYHAETYSGDEAWAQMPLEGVTVDYGRYLTNLAGCTTCHEPDLQGGDMGPGAPIAADLTAAGRTANWTLDDFVTALRTGVSPDGHHIDEVMPWKFYANMNDEEIAAIWLFLRTETGQQP